MQPFCTMSMPSGVLKNTEFLMNGTRTGLGRSIVSRLRGRHGSLQTLSRSFESATAIGPDETPPSESDVLAGFIVALASDADAAEHRGVADAHFGNSIDRVAPHVSASMKALGRWCCPCVGVQDSGGGLVPALAAVLIGVLLGYAVGGRLGGLAQLVLRFEWLILPLFVIQAIARGRLLGLVGASRLSLAVWMLASAVLALAMALNWRIPGMALGAAGVLMNVDVVLLNAGMPVFLQDSARTMSGTAAAELARGTGGFYRVAGQTDAMKWLGDAMPITTGQSLLLVSPGDIVLMVAVIVVILYGMSLSAKGVRFSP